MLAPALWAQTLVDDQADLLDMAAEQRLLAQLGLLRVRSEVDFRVITMQSRPPGATSDEAYATALFTERGIGAETEGKGILLLLLLKDRFAWIELGGQYGDRFDPVAQEIMDGDMLPLLREGAYGAALEQAVPQIIERIANGTPPSGTNWVPGAVVAGFAALMFVPVVTSWRKRRALRRRPCPRCNQRELSYKDTVLRPATTELGGTGDRHWSCRHCGWSEVVPYTTGRLPTRRRHRSLGSGTLGGGSSGGGSSGGGASGRW